MKIDPFAEQCIVVLTLIISFSCVFSGTVNGKEMFINVDEMECSDTVIKVSTECPSGNRRASVFECTRQDLVFLNRKTGASTKVACSGEPVRDPDTRGELSGNYLDALAVSWACVKGKKEWYLLVRCTTFGTCEDCEWTEIYSLEGYRLAGDRTQYGQAGTERDRLIVEFKKACSHLGLPTPWPRDAFKHIRLLKPSKTTQ